MGKENHKNFSDHVGALHQLLSSVTDPYLRDQLLRKLQLHFYSLGEGFELHIDHGQLQHEPFRFRMAAGAIPQSLR